MLHATLDYRHNCIISIVIIRLHVYFYNENCFNNLRFYTQGGRTITRQGVKLRELFSRQKRMRGRSFARTWRERMTRAICLELPRNW